MAEATVPFNVGVVGAGAISEHHIQAIGDHSQCRFIGVVDIDENKARESAERFGGKAFPSLKALAADGCDVVHVCTPPHTHADLAIEAMNLGCHVMIEKPLTEDEEDAQRVVDAAERTGRIATVNHSYLWDPQFAKAIEAARSGALGKVVSVDVLRGSEYPPYPGGPLPPHYRTAGYPFRDLGFHYFYLLEAFLGPIRDVHATWRSLGGDPNLAFDEWRALVTCERGIGQFQLSFNVKPMQSQVIVQGTKAVLRVDAFSMFHAKRQATPLPKAAERLVNALTDSVQPLVDVPVNVGRFVRKKIRPYQGLRNHVAAFYDALAAGAPPPTSLKDSMRIVHWTEQVARAAEQDHHDRTAGLELSETVPYLVTGASGYLGGAVVRRLLADGHRVRAFQRRLPDPAELPVGLEVVLGNLGDPTAVERAVKGAETVIHVGAAMKGGQIDHQCGTIVGTQNVVDAAIRNGVKRFVHISSMSVVDWAGSSDGTPVSESTALEPRPDERGAYTQSKLAAERIVKEAADSGKLPAVILRPGQIFGGGIPLLTGAVARRVAGRYLVLGDGELALPLVHIDDVVDAIELAAASDLSRGEVIQLIDVELLTQNDVLAAMDGEAQVLRVPRSVVFAGGRLSESMLGLLGRQSPLAEYRLRSAMARLSFESERAKELLAWQPRVGVRRGLDLERQRD